MGRLNGLVSDLVAEHDALDSVVSQLPAPEWARPTPAEGWSVSDQISHLAYFDATASLALVAPERFADHKRALFAGETAAHADVALGRSASGERLLATWRAERAKFLRAAASSDPEIRVPWYGPEMSLPSFVTARLMETWAHGQDIRDAMGLGPSVSDRLRHICHIGVAARRYAYLVHGIEPDETPVRVEATSPSGQIWAWGPVGAPDRITGSALGLAFVFTQRRHRDDTDVRSDGPAAAEWLQIAQAFGGPAAPGRQPGLGSVSESVNHQIPTGG
ncbi:MAG: TIGR03084 family metal-binding protein [Acidimicrobiales bacterium]